jgi:hypothetical protein
MRLISAIINQLAIFSMLHHTKITLIFLDCKQVRKKYILIVGKISAQQIKNMPAQNMHVLQIHPFVIRLKWGSKEKN